MCLDKEREGKGRERKGKERGERFEEKNKTNLDLPL